MDEAGMIPSDLTPSSLYSMLLSEIFPPQHGGSGRWFWEIYRRLPLSQTTVVAGEYPDAKTFDATHEVDIHRLKYSMSDWGVLSLSSLRTYWEVYRSVRGLLNAWPRPKQSPLLLHAGRCLPEGWLAWLLSKRYGIPYVVYAHGEDINTYATSRQLRFLTRHVMWGAKAVIANSENTATLLAGAWRLPRGRVEVLYPGVDIERFQPAPRDERFRREHEWQDRQVILTVGRLQLRKGHDKLIESLVQIKQAIPNVLYSIVGDGEEYPRLQQLVTELGLQSHVRFYRTVDDAFLVQAYQQCDLFVLPNRTVAHDIEGFGMVLVEAQACGKPVIAGDSGGTRETMRPGVTGKVIDCTSSPTIAAEISSLLLDTAKLASMGTDARAWVAERFDWESLFAQASKLFHRAAGIDDRTTLAPPSETTTRKRDAA